MTFTDLVTFLNIKSETTSEKIKNFEEIRITL